MASAASNVREVQRPGNSWCFTCDGPPEPPRPVVRWSPEALAAAAEPPLRIVELVSEHVVVRAMQKADGRIAFGAWPRAAWDAATAEDGTGWLGPPEVSGDDLARAAPHTLPAPFGVALMRFREAVLPRHRARPFAGAVAVARTRPL